MQSWHLDESFESIIDLLDSKMKLYYNIQTQKCSLRYIGGLLKKNIQYYKCILSIIFAAGKILFLNKKLCAILTL